MGRTARLIVGTPLLDGSARLPAPAVLRALGLPAEFVDSQGVFTGSDDAAETLHPIG